MARKTIPVETVLADANHYLEHSPDAEHGERQGVCFMVESVLHVTGNYKGFRYLVSAGVTSPGTADVKISDPTRRRYLSF